jgi:ribosomal protein S18 acetylase RimI-like enzyme
VLADPLLAAGWTLLVERRHYEFAPVADLGHDIEVELTFDQLHDPADPRLRARYPEILRGTLDAHDRADIARYGFDEACVKSLASLLGADPVDGIHLALDADQRVVGMISGRTFDTGRGFVFFVGVGERSRGRGYARQMLGWMTRRLVAEGATVLIADTDNENVPMARTFARAGWPQTETRIDLVIH